MAPLVIFHSRIVLLSVLGIPESRHFIEFDSDLRTFIHDKFHLSLSSLRSKILTKYC